MKSNSLRKLVQVYLAQPSDKNAHAIAQECATRLTTPKKTRKIIISKGSAGWSTWSIACDITSKIMLEHPGIIAALEAKECLTETHPSVLAMVKEIEEAGGEVPYLGAAATDDLMVTEVTGEFTLVERDGSEYVR